MVMSRRITVSEAEVQSGAKRSVNLSEREQGTVLYTCVRADAHTRTHSRTWRRLSRRFGREREQRRPLARTIALLQVGAQLAGERLAVHHPLALLEVRPGTSAGCSHMGRNLWVESEIMHSALQCNEVTTIAWAAARSIGNERRLGSQLRLAHGMSCTR